MAREAGDGQEHALGVGHPGDRGAQHLVEDQVGAVVRVQARAQVGQPAGGAQQHQLAGLEHRLQHRERRQQPALQRRTEIGVGAFPGAQGRAALQKGVLRAQGRGHGVEQQALAQAIGRQDHPLDAQIVDQRLQHGGGVGQGVQAAAGDALDPLQRAARLAGDHLGGLQRLAAGHLVLVDDLQRIAGHAHGQQRQVPPGAADRVEHRRLQATRMRLQLALHLRADPVCVEAAGVLERERAQRQGDAVAGGAAVEPDQLQAGAAQVADQAMRGRRAGEHAEGRIASLFLAAEHPEIDAGLQADLAAELRAVLGVAGGGGGGGEDAVGLAGGQQGGEAAQRRHRRFHPLRRQAAGDRQVAAEAGENLLVEHRPHRAALHAVEHQAYGIRADVDDGGVDRGSASSRFPHGRTHAADPSPCGPGRRGSGWS